VLLRGDFLNCTFFQKKGKIQKGAEKREDGKRSDKCHSVIRGVGLLALFPNIISIRELKSEKMQGALP